MPTFGEKLKALRMEREMSPASDAAWRLLDAAERRTAKAVHERRGKYATR